MREEDQRGAGPLDGRHRRVLNGLVQRIALVMVFGTTLVDFPNELDCATAVRGSPIGIAVTVCQREYERTQEPDTGVRLADSLRQSGNVDGASAIAKGLLATTARSDAFQILGKIAMAQNRTDEAVTALETARKLHRAENKPASLARDDQALAGILAARHRFAEALLTLDECIAEARIARDTMIEGYCHLSAARVLSRVGYFELAQQELDRAKPLTTSDRDLAWLEYERGNLDQDVARAPLRSGHNEQAIVAFERAIALATRVQLTDLVHTAEMNLAYSLAEVGRTDDAERHLSAAQTFDLKNEYRTERMQLAARIAYRRGNLTLAWSLNEGAYSMMSDGDDRLDVATMQVRIALAGNDIVRAEAWARRGIEQVEKTRAEQSAIELRSWVLSTRREPYELLFVILARAGRVEDALLVFDQWQGRTMLDAMARSSPTASADLLGVARRVEKLGAWLPVVSSAPFVKTGDGRAVIDTLRKVDLLALVIAEREVWSITANLGQLRIHNLGPITALQERLDRFVVAPTDRAVAVELGELILRDGIFRSTRDSLHVLLDGPLASMPVVALRREGRPLIAARPVVRVPRLPASSCVTVQRTTHATVLADPAGDLPAARREATEVAALLETTTTVGSAATSNALFGATRDAVLHIAVHAEIDAGGGVLKLYDQAVSALEISAHKLGPSLVVLSACGSARSNDVELAGSLATAFLAGGSAQVVATLRPVSDAGALELATRFYRAGGAADPVRVLAAIQASLAETSNTDWPSFAVFGHDVCPKP